MPENIKNSFFEAVLFRNVFHLMYLRFVMVTKQGSNISVTNLVWWWWCNLSCCFPPLLFPMSGKLCSSCSDSFARSVSRAFVHLCVGVFVRKCVSVLKYLCVCMKVCHSMCVFVWWWACVLLPLCVCLFVHLYLASHFSISSVSISEGKRVC